MYKTLVIAGRNVTLSIDHSKDVARILIENTGGDPVFMKISPAPESEKVLEALVEKYLQKGE